MSARSVNRSAEAPVYFGIKLIISHVRLFMIISHVKIIAFQTTPIIACGHFILVENL